VLPTHVIDLDADDRQERARVSLDWAWDGNERVKGAAIAAYWQQAKNLQQTEEDRLTAADRLRINSFDTTIFGLQANMSFGFEAAGTNSRLIIGGDWYWTQVEGLRDGTVPTPPDVFPTRAFPPTETFNGGFFLGDEISLANGRLLLFPGLRLDVYSLRSLADPANPSGVVPVNLSDSALSPKFGMTFRATPGFSVIATYSQGFKAPAPYEVNNFFDNPTSPFFAYRSLPNPDLRPERSRTIEGGFRVEEGPANAQLTAYVGRYTDFISQEQVSGSGTIRDPLVFQFVNLAEVDISGLEASTNLDLGRGVTLSYAMAWTKGRTRDPLRGDRPLLTIDPIEMVAGLQYEDPEGRFGGEMVTTIAGAKELDETSGNCTPSCLVSRDWLLFDMTAWWAMTPRVMLRLGAFNLTNARYIEWSTIAGLADTPANRAVADAFTSPGRNVRLTISLSFP
jgi:hemoglobin/transferrin/lactoferrin receptor protein